MNLFKFILMGVLFFAVVAQAEEQTGVSQEKVNAPTTNESAFQRIIPEIGAISTNFQAGAGGPAANFNNSNGFAVGVLADIGKSSDVVMETGLLYRQLNGNTQQGFASADFTNSYLSLPVAAKYYFNGQYQDSLYLKAGVSGSLLVGQSNNYSGNYQSAAGNLEGRSWQTSLLAALGGKFAIGKQNDLYLEAGYNQVIESLFTDADVYGSGFNFTAGVSINL